MPGLMNDHERRAWEILVAHGAEQIEIGGKPALDLSTAKPKTRHGMADFVTEVIEVVGRSGANRRHVDRRGNLSFVVSDDRAAANMGKKGR